MRKKLGSLLAIAVLAAAAAAVAPRPPQQRREHVYALNGDMVFADPALVSDGNSYSSSPGRPGPARLQPARSAPYPVLAAALPTVSSMA